MKHEILTEINNGNAAVLVFISGKYFPTVRRMLRVSGIRDEQTPGIFADVLAKVYADLRSRADNRIDFETYFMNAMNEEVKSLKNPEVAQGKYPAGESEEVAARCVSILDEEAQKLLFARVADKLSYERIREEFQFSNAVIAQYEVTKAMDQLEGIVKLRMNISSN